MAPQERNRKNQNYLKELKLSERTEIIDVSTSSDNFTQAEVVGIYINIFIKYFINYLFLF